ELAEQFSILVRATNCGRFKSLSPLEFKRLIGRIKTSFAGYDQQDSQEFLALMMDKLHEDVCQEFLALMMDKLHEDVCQIRHKPYLKAPDDNIDPAEAANITWDNHRKRNESLMLNLFDYVDCCKQGIIIGGFQYDGMWRQKLQTAVSFPVDGLDMSGYITGPTKRPAYHLYGVSNHYGTMHGGHYTAFCKNAHNQRWFKFDDQVVTEMSANDIVSSAAYLLFYTSFEFTPPKLI
ncbi:predicted protein, partial [Nematostella vectensis]